MTDIIDATFLARLKTDLALTNGSGSATFTRPSPKNVFDNEGKLITVKPGAVTLGGVRCEQNLYVNSEDFTTYDTHLCTAVNEVTSTPRATSGLVSKITADSVADGRLLYVYKQTPQVIVGDRVSVTLYAKSISQDFIQIYTSNYTIYANFNVGSGVVGTVGPNIIYADIVAADNGWYRLGIIYDSTFNNYAAAVSFVPSINSAWTASGTYVGTEEFYLFGLTLDTSDKTKTTLNLADDSNYISAGVLAAPYHGAGADGIKYFDTDSSGNAIEASAQNGALIDPDSKTNTMLHCRDFTNAAWVKTNVTAAKTSTGITGQANSCSRLTATANNATILQTITAAAAAGCTGYDVKRVTGTGAIYITRDNVSWTDITSLINTSTFETVAIENTSVTNPIVGFKFAVSGDAIDVDAGRNHLGTQLCEPIFTETASVTRAAESLTYQTASNFSDTAGTILATFTPLHSNAWPSGAIVGKADSGLLVSPSNTGVQAADSTNTVSGATGAPANSSIRLGCRWSVSSLEAFSADPLLNVGTTGSYDGGFDLSTIAINPGAAGYIKDVAIFNTSLSDADVKDAWKLLDTQTFLPAFSNLPIYNEASIIHVEPDPAPVDPEPTPDFATEFTGITLAGASNITTNYCSFFISGTDTETGFSPPYAAPLTVYNGLIGGGPGYGVWMYSTTPTNTTSNAAGAAVIGSATIVDTTVRGEATKALRLKYNAPGYAVNQTKQMWYQIYRNTTTGADLPNYTVRYELKIPTLTSMLNSSYNRITIFDAKSAGDFRYYINIVYANSTIAAQYGCAVGTIFFEAVCDNSANGGLGFLEFWRIPNVTETVPQNENFTFEVSWTRAANYTDYSTGRFRMRIRRESDAVDVFRDVIDVSQSALAVYNTNHGTSYLNRHMGINTNKIQRMFHGIYPRILNVDCQFDIAKFRTFTSFDV